MRAIDKRIAQLEEQSVDKTPYVVFQAGNISPVIPEDIGDRPVMIIRWAIVEPPVRDKDDNIIAPAREWDDNDPRYRELLDRRVSAGRGPGKPYDPALDPVLTQLGPAKSKI